MLLLDEKFLMLQRIIVQEDCLTMKMNHHDLSEYWGTAQATAQYHIQEDIYIYLFLELLLVTMR